MTHLPHPIPYQGSKRRLAPVIARYLPDTIATFYEPFAGSGAMTIHAAFHGRAERYVLADSLEPMVDLLRAIVEKPEETAARYRCVWEGQRPGRPDYFNAVRDRYNSQRNPIDLLYLICRCVKNSVRFSQRGHFSQSVDRRRLGMHPERMRRAVFGVAAILGDRVDFRTGDWRATCASAGPDDFVYLDPPYLGASVGRDKRYHQQVRPRELISGLASLRRREVPFALSYDGMTGGRGYGPQLPETLGLTRRLLHAGISAQATLAGRREETIESLYLTPGLAEPLAEPVDGRGRATGEAAAGR